MPNDTIWLEAPGIRVGVRPAYGARVTSLVDRATGRDWIAPGVPSPNTGENAAYLAAEAGGWDECFPNVDRFDPPPPWSGRLRDHGDVWGRPWAVTERSPAMLSTRFEHPLFTLGRTLRCTGNAVTADYALANRGAVSLPFLWAMHLLLAVRPGERIDLPGVTGAEVAHLAAPGMSAPPATVPWPGGAAGTGFALDVVQPPDRDFAAKLYVPDVPSRSAGIVGTDGVLRLEWDSPWPALGVWLNYGGWPEPGPVHHVALEPTSAPSGTFTSESASLAPGGRLSWRVSLAVGPGTSAA